MLTSGRFIGISIREELEMGWRWVGVGRQGVFGAPDQTTAGANLSHCCTVDCQP
jgi:hypothetical protein